MEPGLRLTGRYRLDRRLDGGGPGEVWRGWDEALNRPVAVRLPGPGRTDGGPGCDPGAIRERVKRAVRVTHPAFVTIYDCDRAENGEGGPVAFVVTPMLDGESLARRLARGPLPLAEALDCCAQVAGALAAAHEAGMAHGALGPDKIFLTSDGVRIVDLGVGPPGDGASGNDAGEIAGDMAGDIAALGTLLTASLNVMDVPSLADVPGIPEEVVRLCAQCFSADPADRLPASRAAEILEEAKPPAEPPAVPPAEPEPAAIGATLVHEGPGPAEERPPGRPAADLRGEAGPIFRVAVTVTVLAASLAVILMLADRGTMNGAFYGGGNGAVQAPSPASSSPATPTPDAMSPVPEPAVYDTLGRLQPIVDDGRASGAIRSDVAIDLNNSIANLRNDLAAGRTADASQRLRLLREKIDTRLRERALDQRVAERMTDVLATASP